MNNSLYAGKMIAGKPVQNWNASGTFLMAKIPWNVLTFSLPERMPQCTFFSRWLLAQSRQGPFRVSRTGICQKPNHLCLCKLSSLSWSELFRTDALLSKTTFFFNREHPSIRGCPKGISTFGTFCRGANCRHAGIDELDWGRIRKGSSI